MALLDNGAQVNTITPRYVCEHSLEMGPITVPYGFQSHLCRAGQCLYKTAGLCSDLGLGRWSLGL